MEKTKNTDTNAAPKTIKSIVNTPLKKFIFVFQILSWFLIVGSPIIGGLIGKVLNLKAAAIAGVIFGVFIAGEILFYATLALLGKELILLIKYKSKTWFAKLKNKKEIIDH
ncbi:MAG: hypothetical protein PF517_01045 [Salinivirgaceae bacterium]|jgi:hypothetical protein|nr:hypothetical protein [Salinivirgaceae bacterium]